MKQSSKRELVPSGAHHIVAHRGGFEEADIKPVFEDAGLTNFAFVTVTTAKSHGHSVQLFLASGTTKVDV